MGILASALDAFEDDASKKDEVIKSGTLRTTRGTALVAFSVLAIMAILNEAAPDVLGLDQLSAAQKFYGAIAIGFVWALTAAADALARGLASGNQASTVPSYMAAMDAVTSGVDSLHGFRPIDPPLAVQLTDKAAADEKGWLVVATALRSGHVDFCAVKGDKVEWRHATDASVKWGHA